MTCNKCGEKPKKSCGAFPKAVIEIDNPEKIVLLRKVMVPASMGDESTFPPTIGKYHNVLLEYEASGGIYLYSSDGIPTKLSSDVAELQAQLNALRVRVGQEEVARADADTALSNRITSLDDSLATVARTGSYNDLSNKPTIGNGTLTIKKNGSNVGTFTANATTNKEIDISVPTRTSDLANDGSDGTSTYVEADELSTVATSGSYNDLTNKPTIGNATLTIKRNGTDAGTFTANATTNKSINIAVPTKTSDLTNDGSDGASTYVEADELSTVATTGSYNDLTNKPTIPTVNDATLTIQKNGTNVQTFTANSSTNKTANITVPTAVSELTNDASYATTTQLNDGLATKQNTLTAGDNIQINGNTISATDTTYTAGNAIDITNGEISADIHPADFFTAGGVVSDCGNDLSLDGTIASTLESVELKGDTYQQTYSGAQLLTKNGMATPYTDSDYWSLTAGASNTDLGDGWGRWAHTGTTTWVNVMPQMSAAISGGTYKTSTVYTILFEWKNVSNFDRVTISQPGNAQDPFDGEETTVGISLSQTSGTSKIALTTKSTLTNDMRAVRMFFTKHTASGDASIDIRVTVVEGDYSSSDLQWQPYVGGVASPNPDYPQDIQVVTGEQTVKVTGQNLFDINGANSTYRASKTISGQSITSTATTNKSGYVAIVIPNSDDLLGKECTITFNAQASVGDADLDIATSRLASPSIIGTRVKTMTGNGDQSDTVTFPTSYGSAEDCFIVLLRPHTSDSTWSVGDYAIFTNIQIKLGPATDYQPYQSQSYPISLGSIELCKIGDYQDYIYKSGDDWYLHKEVRKITFNSSTDWAKHSTTQGNVFTLASTGLVGYTYNSGQIAPALMDTDRVIELGSMADNAYGVFGVTNAEQLRVFRGDYDSSYTAAVFKSEMTGHYIYGALATPTDTKITDATLVAQLNTLAEAKSYNDQTNIIVTTAGDNLPATLCVEAYRKSLSGVIEAIDNACTCRNNLVVYLPNGMTTYTNNDAPITIPDALDAFHQGRAIFLVDDTNSGYSTYMVTAVDADDGIWSMKAEAVGINAYMHTGFWQVTSEGNLSNWKRVEFFPDTPGGEEATHLVLSNPTTATWNETGGIAIPYSDGSAVSMGTFVSTDVVFTKDDGTTMTVGDLYTALTNGKSFEIDLPFGEINSACSRDSAAIVATVENVKLDGSSKQTLDQTSQGRLSEMYTSSVPVAVHLSTPWGGVLLDERFGVEHLTIDDGGTVTSSYRFVVNTYETFQPPR